MTANSSTRQNLPAMTRLQFLLCSVVLLLSASRLTLSAQNRTSDQFALTILHTNDLHGHIFPFAYTETGRSKEEYPSVGGAARRATLIRKLRREIKNPVLLVDGGDTFTRGPLTNQYEGIADVEAMNAVGYELAAIGNNEFKAKDGYEVNDAAGAQAALLQVVKRSNFHWLCANATDGKGAILEGVLPYVVREIEGVRVGFLGLTAPRVADYPQAVGWTISDPIATAKQWIPKARQQCDILIALTHIGFDLDKQLAAQTTGLDAIVGGDSHTFLYKAEEVANLDGKKIPIVQDGEFGVNLGRFDLRFGRNGGKWTLTSYDSKLIPVDAKIKEAPDVVAKLKPYLEPMLSVVGHLDSIGPTPAERTLQTNRVIVDAMKQQTGADYALYVADNIFDVFRHKDVTRYDLWAILPFKNRVVTANLTGAEMLQAMKQTTSPTQIAGDFSSIVPTKTYKVALVDYHAENVYKLPKEKISAPVGDVREVIMAWFAQQRR